MPGDRRKTWLARATASTLGLVVALGVMVQARAAAQPNPHPTSRFVVSHADLPSTSLQPGRAQHATLRGPDVHRYRLTLRRGQFAAVELRQLQGNVAAVVFDPDGGLVDIVDIVDQNGAGQAEVATIVARKSGDYTIQVAVFEWDVPDTRYTIEASGGGIAVRHARLAMLPLLAQDTDAFASSSPFLPSLTFVRDEAGHVTGFTIRSEDVGTLPFHRVAP